MVGHFLVFFLFLGLYPFRGTSCFPPFFALSQKLPDIMDFTESGRPSPWFLAPFLQVKTHCRECRSGTQPVGTPLPITVCFHNRKLRFHE